MSIDLKRLIEARTHIATLKNQAHPKTRKYWLDVVNGLVVLNPEMIAESLKQAKKKIQEAKKEGKNIVIVSEKKMYAEEIGQLCTKNDYFYLNKKVPSGFLSNFETFMARLDSVNKMRTYMDSEAFLSLTKKEQSVFKRKYDRINRLYKGVAKLQGKVNLVVVLDAKMLEGFVKELALQPDVDRVLIASTNFNSYVEPTDIICNMLSYKSVDFVMKYLLS